jgi:hypothetical protein
METDEEQNHALFEENLKRYLACHPSSGARTSVPLERVRAARCMIKMVCDPPIGCCYVPRATLPLELEEQFQRIRDGIASPTHALEALVGAEAIGALNIAEGRTGRGR